MLRFILLMTLGLAAAIGWNRLQQPKVEILPAPPATRWQPEKLLRLIAPQFPEEPLWIETRLGAVKVEKGQIEHVAALRDRHTGEELWGVGYSWVGPTNEKGGRAVLLGFAVVAPPSPHFSGELRYLAPGLGGWEKGNLHAFENTLETRTRIEAVPFERHSAGFLVQQSAESALGGRLGRGVLRAFSAGITGWEKVFEEETMSRFRPDRTYEVAREARHEMISPDGGRHHEVALKPTWYIRQLTSRDKGIHFLAEIAGSLVFRHSSGQFSLDTFLDQNGKRHPVRPAPPIYAIRAPKSPIIDASFDDWESAELSHIGTVWLEDLELLRYRRRQRRGTHDFSGAARVMWDSQALYIRADVMDDKFRPSEPGYRLFEGDHITLWLDRDLQSDFAQGIRNADDWQIGLAPTKQGDGLAWAWVPESGTRGILVASKPLTDPFDGALRGYQLEAAIPWEAVGGRPPLKFLSTPPTTDPRLSLQARRYSLHLAGVLGLTLVLTDADERPQEMAFVSAPRFSWGEPRTFNPLFLLDWSRLP
ncbi:MAG: sugar-binding protein [Candidatus Sericytochromatia bacterium]|nr:sugar-binding protein [Candidatus Sericytochromatia bacterium]